MNSMKNVYLSTAIIMATVALTACGAPKTASEFEVEQEMFRTDSKTYTPSEKNDIQNPFLVDSVWQMGHVNMAQTDDTLASYNPERISSTITEDQIVSINQGMWHLGHFISAPYADGKKVIWTNGAHYVSKIDLETFEVIDQRHIPGQPEHDLAANEEIIAAVDDPDNGYNRKFLSVLRQDFPGLNGTYTLVDAHNNYYIETPGEIFVYGSNKGLAASSRDKIEVVKSFKRPTEVTGKFIGMNMSPDGFLLVSTDEGFFVAINTQDFSEYYFTELSHRDNAATFEDGNPNDTWIRNGFPSDSTGSSYVASVGHLHKVSWDGERKVLTEEWAAEYPNEVGRGTGSTPSLMGFGKDDDKLVILTDGNEVMNMTAFWRDEIPADAKEVPGAPSKRIAGLKRIDFGVEEVESAQQEQGVVVSGYGLMVVNNEPRNEPFWVKQLPPKAHWVFIGAMNGFAEFAPTGVQKFHWNPVENEIEVAWINHDVTAPSMVNFVSSTDNTAVVMGAREDHWTVEGIDWDSGETVWTQKIEPQSARYNGFFTAPIIDDGGNFIYGGMYGSIRLSPFKD